MALNPCFSKISEIDLARPESWEAQLFLVFDVDWASDAVLSQTIDIVEEANVAATWLMTHDTPLLSRLRANPKFELGIHPNFSWLLFDGNPANGATPREIVDRLMQVVPEAVTVRSHSMTQSSPIIEVFQDFGLRYECNSFIPVSAGMPLQPWEHWNGMTKVPIFWEDDVHMIHAWPYAMADLAGKPGLKVAAFHPIHVMLNTDTLERYEASRPAQRDWAALQAFINPGDGVRQQLEDWMQCSASALAQFAPNGAL